MTLDQSDRIAQRKGKEPARAYAARRSIETGLRYSVWESESGVEYAARDCAHNSRTYRELGACKVATYARGHLIP